MNAISKLYLEVRHSEPSRLDIPHGKVSVVHHSLFEVSEGSEVISSLVFIIVVT